LREEVVRRELNGSSHSDEGASSDKDHQILVSEGTRTTSPEGASTISSEGTKAMS